MGDPITTINGRDQSIGPNLTEVIGDIRGKKAGETVELTISRRRGTTFETFPVKIVRAQVQTKEASKNARQWLRGCVVSVLLATVFRKNLAKLFIRAAQRQKPCQPTTRRIIDLAQTYNPKADCKLKGLSIDLRSSEGSRLG
ncbi:MAG: hypothetical protein IPI39_11905 [Candidatus Obscuribacter sp.]|nr:hypothetical protein [Candidatus Obscuribacter sp.]